VAGDGVTAQNPLFDNVVTELKPVFDWSTVVGLWAADVIQLKSSNEYLMYYNSCKGDEAVSAMGIASAAQIEGPYTDSGLFLKSGFYFHNQKNPDGSNNNTAVDPNAIDPDAFYDAEGRLWLVYGSYSGGIFILELDPATGRPKAGQTYYGKHLLGGGHAPIEGPYIQYSQDSGYYYLFTSYGGLAAADGYNMRIARSKAPNGPYVDAAGVDQVGIKAPGDITKGGVKIMGNHQWAGTNKGYLSAGHNSAYYDAATGQHFLIFHTRFPTTGKFHQLRVHEMFVNVDGWLVASPLRYAPRTNSSGIPQAKVEYVGLSEIGGTYQMVNHGRDMAGTAKQSVQVTLGADGSVSGALSGTWRFGGNNTIALTLGGTAFTGALSRQWSEVGQEFRVTLTALNAAGEALWGVHDGA
jgi:arabinan endo-1,5-alpha-L-arabinosidase